MNVLLITFSFPPAGGVGVLRALSFAKYLPEHDLRLDVLTARNAPSVGRDDSLLEQVPEAVTVHRCWTLDLPFALRKGIKRLVSGRTQGKGHSKGPGQSTGKGGGKGGNPLKRFIADLLLPDPQVGWLPFAFPAAKRIILSRGIDAVLITVPPFSTARLVPMLRQQFPRLPIFIDFRDEWLTTTLDLVSFNNNAKARAVAQKVESEAVRDGTAVVMVTEAARQEIMGRYPGEPANKFFCIPNGFEGRPAGSVSTSPGARAESRVVLTYIGSVYGSTDPQSFVEAVLALPEELRQKLLVRFIGHIETAAYRELLETLGETVELKGFMAQAEALRALDDTDYLLLITHDRINVSAKFYDYLSGNRPIVAAVDPAGEVRRLLEHTNAGYWADINDRASMTALLTRLLDGSEGRVFAPNRERIAGYHRRTLAKQYAALLQEAGSRKG